MHPALSRIATFLIRTRCHTFQYSFFESEAGFNPDVPEDPHSSSQRPVSEQIGIHRSGPDAGQNYDLNELPRQRETFGPYDPENPRNYQDFRRSRRRTQCGPEFSSAQNFAENILKLTLKGWRQTTILVDGNQEGIGRLIPAFSNFFF